MKFRHTAQRWNYCGDLKQEAAASDWTLAEATSPVIPEGTNQVTFGLSLRANGTLITDDCSLTEISVPLLSGTGELIVNGNLATGINVLTCFMIADWGILQVNSSLSMDIPVNSADGRQSCGLNVSSYVSRDANLIQPDAAGCALAGHTPPLAPSSVDSSGVGNKYDVSLTEAAYAEGCQAAGSRHGGKDHSTGPGERAGVNPADFLAPKYLSLGGCLIQDWADGECLPAVPPSLSWHLLEMEGAGKDPASMPYSWACGGVREYFKDGLIVRTPNVDPQNLDTDKDGTACGPRLTSLFSSPVPLQTTISLEPQHD
jgi:hypothetical protein